MNLQLTAYTDQCLLQQMRPWVTIYSSDTTIESNYDATVFQRETQKFRSGT